MLLNSLRSEASSVREDVLVRVAHDGCAEVSRSSVVRCGIE